MGFSSNIQKAAKDLLFERRLNAEKKAESLKNDIFKKLPRAKELEKGITSSGIMAARAVANGGDVVAQMEKLRDSNLAMQKELKELLTSNGYNEDVFEPKYYCKKCGDKGYYDENGKTYRCNCYTQALISCACDELNRYAPLSLSTFKSFSVDYYDKQLDNAYGTTPYEQINKILKYCKNYAKNFSVHSESILMKGATGLGKTHLSLAIANEVINKGYGVIYASAPSLIQELEKAYFSKNKNNDDEESLLSMLLECDLLIVDDLGTEFVTPFSVAQLYNIFNSRMLSNKPIIINTNLTMRELEKSYTDRFVSRINGNARRLDFIGTDIRIRKK